MNYVCPQVSFIHITMIHIYFHLQVFKLLRTVRAINVLSGKVGYTVLFWCSINHSHKVDSASWTKHWSCPLDQPNWLQGKRYVGLLDLYSFDMFDYRYATLSFTDAALLQAVMPMVLAVSSMTYLRVDSHEKYPILLGAARNKRCQAAIQQGGLDFAVWSRH